MKYRIIPHCSHYQRCLCNPSASGLKSKMKESKASEIKKTHKSLIFHLLFLCTLFISSSCSTGTQYDFESSDDALRKYNSFFHSIQEQQVVNSEQMAAYINQWQECQIQSFITSRKTLRSQLMPAYQWCLRKTRTLSARHC